MKTLNEINTEIANLEKQRQDVINARNNMDQENIKSLEWTKACKASFEINPLVCAGLPGYTIKVWGKEIPRSIGGICVMGDSKYYEKNITYRSRHDEWIGNAGEFTTSCVDALIQFIRKVRFQSLDYNKKHLEILQCIAEMKGE